MSIKFTAKIPHAKQPLEFECDHAVLVVMEDVEGGTRTELWWHEQSSSKLITAIRTIADQLSEPTNSPQTRVLGQAVNLTLDKGIEALQALEEDDANTTDPS
jgi:hypothetical protein